MSGFEVIIKTLNNEGYKIKDLTPSSTVGQLIEKVAKVLPGNPNKQTIELVHNGKPINKNKDVLTKSLQSMNIMNKSTLFVVYRVIGG